MTDCALATGIQRAALNIYGRGPIRKVIDMDRTERFFAGDCVGHDLPLRRIHDMDARLSRHHTDNGDAYFGGCHLGKVSHSVI